MSNFWGVVQYYNNIIWENSGITGFIMKNGKHEFSVSEICTGEAILAEGKYMCHCIAYLIDDFTSGKNQLWSIKKKSESAYISYITAMYSNGQLIEAKYRFNQIVAKEDYIFLEEIAKKYLELDEAKVRLEVNA